MRQFADDLLAWPTDGPIAPRLPRVVLRRLRLTRGRIHTEDFELKRVLDHCQDKMLGLPSLPRFAVETSKRDLRPY